MDQVTYFQTLLPPCADVSGLTGARRASGHAEIHRERVPESLMRRTLVPLSDVLRSELNYALAEGDEASALRVAYRAASDLCNALPEGDEPLATGHGRIHALVIDFEDLQWASAADGTLIEDGTVVQMSYRNWTVDGDAAVAAAAALTEHWQTHWPNSWVVA